MDESNPIIQDESDSDDNQEENDYSARPNVCKTYKRRWYILALFSCMACLQCWVWNSFGPIYSAILYVYPNTWTNATVAFMANWGAIVFVVGFLPISYLSNTYGIRFAGVLAALLVAVGTLLRVFSTEEKFFLISAHLCSILNGAAGIVALSVPPALSAVWFPPSERSTATAINQIVSQLGNGFSYLVGPVVVAYDTGSSNVTHFNHSIDDDSSIAIVRSELHMYMIGLASAAVAIFLLILAYFPSKPNHPPSPSGAISRVDFLQGIVQFARNRDAWLSILGYGLPGGVNAAYAAVLAINLKILGVDEAESGRIGVIGVVGCIVTTFAAAYINDKLRIKRMKLILIVLLTITATFNVWLTLIILKLVPFQKWQVYLSCIGGTAFNFAGSPVFFEYTAELSYPASEGLIGGILAVTTNFVATLFLCVFFFPLKSVIWMNYALAISSFIAIPLVLCTKERYRRLEIDQQTLESHQQDLISNQDC